MKTATVSSRREVGPDWYRTEIVARVVKPSRAPEHCIEISIQETGSLSRTRHSLLYITEAEAVRFSEDLVKLIEEERNARAT